MCLGNAVPPDQQGPTGQDAMKLFGLMNDYAKVNRIGTCQSILRHRGFECSFDTMKSPNMLKHLQGRQCSI